MKYTVTFTAFAEYQLADIWLRARNRQAVTQAADYLDTLLRTDADQVGRLRSDGRRAVVKHPIGYTFEVSVADCRVTVVSIRYFPPTQRPE
jgi:hypothetical protein